MITIKELYVKRGAANIISNLNHSFAKGEFTAILGPNGSGKTTLVKAITGLISYTGDVYYQNTDLKKMDMSTRAKTFAILPQTTHLSTDFSVCEIISMGRFFKNQQIFAGLSSEDKDIIAESMQITETDNLKHRSFISLSGGEKQRVLLARALAQKPKILFLDEPTASLDITIS